jgi:hypothetical protein
VLAAVKQNGYMLEYAAESLKADKEIVLAAVKQHGHALHYAAESLKADKEIVLAAVQQDGYALKYAAEPLKADKDIVLAAVQQNVDALQFAAESFKVNKGNLLAAVQQDGRALEDAAVARLLGADVLREVEATASAHERDLTRIAPAPAATAPTTAPATAPATELEEAASAQPSTSQSPSTEHDGAPGPLQACVVANRRTRGDSQRANLQAELDPIILGDSDDETSARTSKAVDFCVDVESQEWKPPSPLPHDEVVRVKREREEATRREVDARWAERGQRDEQERVRVKRERSDERADSTGDIETTKEVVNVTDELGPPAHFKVTDEQKPCPLCRHCVVIDRARQSNILHCGLGHCKMRDCLAEFCWDCGDVLHHSNGRRATRSSEVAHLAQLGGTRCPKKMWWT